MCLACPALFEAMQDSGLAGMGGAAFPAHAKLAPRHMPRKNPPLPAVFNALGTGLGFAIGLLALGSVRGALGGWLLLFNWLKKRQSRLQPERGTAHG